MEAEYKHYHVMNSKTLIGGKHCGFYKLFLGKNQEKNVVLSRQQFARGYYLLSVFEQHVFLFVILLQ